MGYMQKVTPNDESGHQGGVYDYMAVPKAAIMGYMQKVTPNDESGHQGGVYDYMAVPGTLFLFNEDNIEEVCFRGYETKESKGYMALVGTVFDAAEKEVQAAQKK